MNNRITWLSLPARTDTEIEIEATENRLKVISSDLERITDPFVRCRFENVARQLRTRLDVLASAANS